MIDLSTIQVFRDPFTWGLGNSALDEEKANALRAQAPDNCFTLFESKGARDQKILIYPLRKLGEGPGTERNVSLTWAELAASLSSESYSHRVGDLFGLPTDSSLMEINICRWPQGHWLGTHTDLPGKLLTQILYLNAEWKRAYGGVLEILGDAAGEMVAATVDPLPERTVFIKRSDHSFHRVTPVVSGAERLSVQVVWHAPGSRHSQWREDSDSSC
jgi:hypothetical protein